MTKKAVSTSNVPHNNNNHSQSSNISHTNSSKPKSPQKQHNSQVSSQNSSMINSKYVHCSTLQQNKPKPKKNRETVESAGSDNNLLMKKLFDAVQKQKEKEQPINGNAGHEREGRRSRKPSAPLPKTLNSSENYAGAAFDRAPAATSFPVPSFIKSSCGGSSPAFSTSCPLPGIDSFKSVATKEIPNGASSVNPIVKPLSVTDLFKSSEEKEPSMTVDSEKKKLESVTNDLRRMLNL